MLSFVITLEIYHFVLQALIVFHYCNQQSAIYFFSFYYFMVQILPMLQFQRGAIVFQHLPFTNWSPSHLSNKLVVTLTDFEKKKSTLYAHFHFLDYFHPPLLVICSYVLVFPKNPILHVYCNLNVYWFCNFCTPSMFIPTSSAIREMRVIDPTWIPNGSTTDPQMGPQQSQRTPTNPNQTFNSPSKISLPLRLF